MNDVIEPLLPEHDLYHRIQCIYAVYGTIVFFNSPPEINVLIIGEDGSSHRIHSIRDHGKTVVLKQLWDIPHVPRCDLNIGIMDSILLTDYNRSYDIPYPDIFYSTSK